MSTCYPTSDKNKTLSVRLEMTVETFVMKCWVCWSKKIQHKMYKQLSTQYLFQANFLQVGIFCVSHQMPGTQPIQAICSVLLVVVFIAMLIALVHCMFRINSFFVILEQKWSNFLNNLFHSWEENICLWAFGAHCSKQYAECSIAPLSNIKGSAILTQ